MRNNVRLKFFQQKKMKEKTGSKITKGNQNK